jgi:hypothetical protein
MNTGDLTIPQIKAMRLQLQTDIGRLCESFCKRSGVAITRVDVDMIDTRHMGASRDDRPWTVGAVNIEIKI